MLPEEELIRWVARAVVDEPDAVEVTATEDDRGVLLELRVADPDLGKIIGRQGRMARALRILLTASAAKNGRHVHLDIID
jgi:uncharacterized protein